MHCGSIHLNRFIRCQGILGTLHNREVNTSKAFTVGHIAYKVLFKIFQIDPVRRRHGCTRQRFSIYRIFDKRFNLMEMVRAFPGLHAGPKCKGIIIIPFADSFYPV